MIYIYTLSDPTTGEIRYVGKTSCTDCRMKQHISEAKSKHWLKTHKHCWIRSLFPLVPIMNVIDECSEENWKVQETYWIIYFRNNGVNLCNHTDGGADTPSKKTPVRIYNETGTWINSFVSIGEASEATGVCTSVICRQCKYRRAKSKNTPFYFRYESDNLESIERLRKRYGKYRTVIQYDLKMNFIREWESAGHAAEQDGSLSKTAIHNCCYGYTKTHSGFIFKFKN